MDNIPLPSLAKRRARMPQRRRQRLSGNRHGVKVHTKRLRALKHIVKLSVALIVLYTFMTVFLYPKRVGNRPAIGFLKASRKVRPAGPPCAPQANRTDEQNDAIAKQCQEQNPKLFANSLDFDRYVCGSKVSANSSAEIETSHCDMSKKPHRVFHTTPTRSTVATIVTWFGQKNIEEALFEHMVHCNVPCATFGEPGTSSVRHIETVRHERWNMDFSMEGSQYYPNLIPDADDWRKNHFYATTSFESDIPLPYFSWDEYRIQTSPVEFESVIPGAAFLARNCHSHNNREELISALMKTPFRVDSLSSCLHNAEPPPGVKLGGPKDLIMREYMFYLAIENQCTDDYITEKLWGALQAGVVPIYHGAPNIKDHIPPNSIVVVDDFKDAAALGEYLVKVATNKTLYESYHAWREKPLPQSFIDKYELTHTHSTCRTCRWAFARQYGWGWNHKTQQLSDSPHARNASVVDNGWLVSPVMESWDITTPEDRTTSTKHQLSEKNRVWQDESKTVERTLYAEDGTIDWHIRFLNPALAHRKVTMRLETPLVGGETTYKGQFREGVWWLQDNTTRYTLLIRGTVANVKVKDRRTFEVVVNQGVELRLLVEQIDNQQSHVGADKRENFFGKLMADDFLHPLEQFLWI